jgi:hypothetical protein
MYIDKGTKDKKLYHYMYMYMYVCVYIYIICENCWFYNRNRKTPRVLSAATISVLSCVIKWTRGTDTGTI